MCLSCVTEYKAEELKANFFQDYLFYFNFNANKLFEIQFFDF